MPLNYSLEAIKWKMVLKNLEEISFIKTVKSVFTGLSVGFITPNNIGDYAGRISFLKKENRLSAIPLLFLVRLTQLLTTIWAGSFALFYFLKGNLFKTDEGNIIFTSIVLLIVTLCIFNLHKIPLLLFRNKIFAKFFYFLDTLQKIKLYNVLLLSIASMFRHFIFILQFYFVFCALNSTLTLEQVFLGTSAALLVKSVLPGFKALNDLGIREAASIYFYHHFSESSLTVAGVCLIIWVINMVMPALIGLMIIMVRKKVSN